jgi:hypothetical protein
MYSGGKKRRRIIGGDDTTRADLHNLSVSYPRAGPELPPSPIAHGRGYPTGPKVESDKRQIYVRSEQ